ncbi:MAG: hypothetical protein ACJ8AG_03150 [Ktedonobacteraceae bacterium]
MQVGPPFLREVRSAQYLASALVILGLIDTGITTAVYWKQMEATISIVLLAMLGYWLFFCLLVWQLGRLREWARRILLGLAYLNVIGIGWEILQLAFVGPIQGSMLYKVYHYGGSIIFAMLNVSLSYYLAKSSVRDACQVRRSRTSASDIPQNTR